MPEPSQRGARQAQSLERANGADDREVFRLLVTASLEDGLVRYSRRRELLRAAERLGLDRFAANLIIAEVQYGPAHPSVPESRHTIVFSDPLRGGSLSAPDAPWSWKQRLWLPLLLLSLLELAAICYLLR